MKQKQRQLGQYIGSNHDFDGSIDDFLEETAPYIGRVVHSFNSLDSCLNSTLCELIFDRADSKGAIIIHKMSFSEKVDLFYRLVRESEIRTEKELPSFPAFIEDLRKCGQLRNAVIHAEWDSLDADGYTYVKMNFTKNGMEQHYWQFTVEALKEINSLILQTADKFLDFYNEQQIFYCDELTDV